MIEPITAQEMQDGFRAFCNRSMHYRSMSAKDIIRQCAEKHGLTVERIKSADRARIVSRPRQEAMYRLHHELSMSISAIGRAFDRDHTTALHGIRAHRARILEVRNAD